MNIDPMIKLRGYNVIRIFLYVLIIQYFDLQASYVHKILQFKNAHNSLNNLSTAKQLGRKHRYFAWIPLIIHKSIKLNVKAIRRYLYYVYKIETIY